VKGHYAEGPGGKNGSLIKKRGTGKRESEGRDEEEREAATQEEKAPKGTVENPLKGREGGCDKGTEQIWWWVGGGTFRIYDFLNPGDTRLNFSRN